MSFFKNKHVITAMIVAPILAIASYYAVDLMVKEQPKGAVKGQAYKLIAKSNCRYSSGECDLVNGDFKSTVTIRKGNENNRLEIVSVNTLSSASVGFVALDGTETGPFELDSLDDGGKRWVTEFSVAADKTTTLRVAMTAKASSYFAETTMEFSEYQTSFDQDFRKKTSVE